MGHLILSLQAVQRRKKAKHTSVTSCLIIRVKSYFYTKTSFKCKINKPLTIKTMFLENLNLVVSSTHAIKFKSVVS
jgi:hypothetical protein